MHFQTDRINVKILMSFGILILGLTGCVSAKHQQTQNERDTRSEAYEDVQRKESLKRRRNFLSDDMLGKWRFLELVIEERGGSKDILKVKAARTARRLKGLTLRFRKSGNTAYHYHIENMVSETHGTYTTRAVHREDSPKSGRIHFYPISGIQIPYLLFNFAKGIPRRVLLSDGETLSTILKIDIPRISMKEKQMDLTLDLGMVLTPDGWLHRGNIRCSFERIE